MNHVRNLGAAIDKLRAAHTGTTHGTTTKASGGDSSLALPGVGHVENQAFENGITKPPASGAEEIADARHFEAMGQHMFGSS
jgi:hypothetical protein